jgi:multidrug transporter EmrE-like cation transporter
MSVLLILLIAAILHASWNAFVKDQNNGLVTVTIISSTMALLVLPFTFIVGLPSPEILNYLLISTVAHTLYLHAMTRAYSLYDFSIAYPFARGLAPLITVLILMIFFNAEVDMFEFIGILLIVSAILLLLPKKISEIGFKNILSMLYFPIAIAFYTIVDAEGIQHAKNPYQYIVWVFIFTAIPMLAYNLTFNKDNLIATLNKNKARFSVTAVISITSYTLVLWAYTQAPTHYVASVRESSIIFASLIGLYFFKENGVKKRLFAALILFTGIILLQMYA